MLAIILLFLLVEKIYSDNFNTIIIGGGSLVGTNAENLPGTSVSVGDCRNIIFDGSNLKFVTQNYLYSLSVLTPSTIGHVVSLGTMGLTYGLSTSTTGEYYLTTDTRIYRCTNTDGCAQLGSHSFTNARGIWLDSGGMIYVVDRGTNQIYQISKGSTVKSVFAGTGTNTKNVNNFGDGSWATSAGLRDPHNIWGDGNGNIFFTDTTLNGVFLISNGKIHLIAGGGTGQDPAATNIAFSTPTEITGDDQGNLFVGDGKNIYYLYPASVAANGEATIDVNGVISYNGYLMYTHSQAVTGLAFRDGLLYFSEGGTGTNRIYSRTESMPTEAPTTRIPTTFPTKAPSCTPTVNPTDIPSAVPSIIPTKTPTVTPSVAPTLLPSFSPSVTPTTVPSCVPSPKPTISPSVTPSMNPSVAPTRIPTMTPSLIPSAAPTWDPTASPSALPTKTPTVTPSIVPSFTPSAIPSVVPTRSPTMTPTVIPTVVPSLQPSFLPSLNPSVVPSREPTRSPSVVPSTIPTVVPTTQIPTLIPTVTPSMTPSYVPTWIPTTVPSAIPTKSPTVAPSVLPTLQPSFVPSMNPTMTPSATPTLTPSCTPSVIPTGGPSVSPSFAPTMGPSRVPSMSPTINPTANPTRVPSVEPSVLPTAVPSQVPSQSPSIIPTVTPSRNPSVVPSFVPSCNPTVTPSGNPTQLPSPKPSLSPSIIPSRVPSRDPTVSPSVNPSFTRTDVPTRTPMVGSTEDPSAVPTIIPTLSPSVTPSNAPSEVPSVSPSMIPSCSPTRVPSETPSQVPTYEPTVVPSLEPSVQPTADPTTEPTYSPSVMPSCLPTNIPSQTPSELPTDNPTWIPTERPSEVPSGGPSYSPSAEPSEGPTTEPTLVPSGSPTGIPTVSPSSDPTMSPTEIPSAVPTVVPSTNPSLEPTVSPTEQPSSLPTTNPSKVPSLTPIASPSEEPTIEPTQFPSCEPTPTVAPSEKRNAVPTLTPSEIPIDEPTVAPSIEPVFAPTVIPSEEPTVLQTVVPSEQPSVIPVTVLCEPSQIPIVSQSMSPTQVPVQLIENPSFDPSTVPSEEPSVNPTADSSGEPSKRPTVTPSEEPSQIPTVTPSGVPSMSPTQVPSLFPSFNPSETPTEKPTADPSNEPTVVPTLAPTDSATTESPSREPTLISSSISPTVGPTEFPTVVPTVVPFELPTMKPSENPSETPSVNPTRTSTVIPTTSSPTATPSEAVVPNFISATFTNEGSSIIFKFDMTTNQGKLFNSFFCSKLFDFRCASQSVCQWMDSKTISGSVCGAEGCAVPGDSVSLLRNNNITISCAVSNCISNGLSASPKLLVIQAPASPVVPTITVRMPSSLGQCSSLLLDLSGSLGSGGREWRNVSVRASSSSSVDTIALNRFLARNFTISPPTSIPAVYFTAGISYSFQVSLCNFLGRCGHGSASVVVTQTLLPTVTIDGSAVRNVLISQPIVLSSTAFVANCNVNPSSLGINYVWKAMNSDLQVISSVSSTSRDPSRFTLPAFSLTANKIYKIQVSASFNQQVSSALAQINTLSGALVAVVQGVGNQVVRIGSSLSLDGSKSYDQDQNNVFGISAGLSFTWTCTQLSPVVSASCSDVIEPISGLEKVLVKPLLTATGASLQFTLTVRDQTSQRTASSTVTVGILPLLSTSISLRSNAVQNVINPDQSLTVLGTVSIPASLRCVLNWSTDSSITGLDLTKAVLTPLFSLVPASADGLNIPINLKLFPNVLLGGFTYSFKLTSRLESPGVGSSLTMTVMVNSPPKLGSFIISPSEGEELTTLFSFSCARWQDDNLPLQYQFSYLTSTGNKLTMRSIADTSFTSLTLPAGENTRGNDVQGIADVFDSYLANVSSSATVKVRASSLFEDTTKVQAFLEQSSAALLSTNVDVVKQAAVMNAYLLNKINCTSTPDGCTAQMDHRTRIIQGIQSLATLEDISTQAVTGWISYLQAATQIQSQLSVEGGNLALTVIRSIVSGVNESGLSPVVMYDALNLLNSISAVVTVNKTRNHHRGRKLESTELGIGRLQDSLADYVKVVVSSLLPNEDSLAQVTSNIKTRLQTVSQNSKCSKSAQSISLPQSTEENELNAVTSSFSFGCLSSADDLHIGLSSISSVLYHQPAFESDPLALYLSSLPCDDQEHCFITISLARKNNENTRRLLTSSSSGQVFFTTSCYDQDHSEHIYRCPDGVDYKVTCTGEAQLIESRCPSTSYQPSCNLLGTGGNINKETCKVISNTTEVVTCNCSLSSLITHRRLGSSSGNSSSVVKKEVNVNYVSMLEGITTSFKSTVVSADSLTTAKLEKGWQALTVVCVFVGAIVLSMVLSYRADKEARKVEAVESKKIQSKLLGRPLSMGAKKESCSENILELAELALPNMLSSKPFSQKMMEELKRHHRWLGIIFHFSDKFPRILRVLSLATNVIIMLFIQSLTYSLSKGDDGTCSHYHEESDCLAPKSTFATGQSKCYWIPPSSTAEGRCGFVTPDNSVEVILFVAIFSGIVSTPLAILADWIIIRILAAPDLHPMLKNTASKIMDVSSLPVTRQVSPVTDKKNRNLVPEMVENDGVLERASSFFLFNRLSTFINRKSQVKDGQELARNHHIYQEFNLLTKEILDYRLKIENQNDRNEFDSKSSLVSSLLLI
jgi:hypothetical protein